ncbi:CcdC protein domain-containing protein [Paenibacillus sepulcri]|uniref:DUF1453 family protein n=1 Tax=Paenibacillus sepulcri TaxID=359917 RepID=A0ABS7CBC3_9BACL|nr:DUF1453 family protein [Paenibacillus sepulcri]
MSSSAIYLIIIVIIILRLGREREVQPSRMWITPVLYAFVIASGMVQSFQPKASTFLLYLLCLIIGLALGIWRGRVEIVRVNPATGKITSQSTAAGIALFVGAMVLRLLVEYWGKGHALVLLSNALLLIPLGSVCARRYIIYSRYRQMVSQHR